MTPAVRWTIGIVLLLVAGALWMWWKPGDTTSSQPVALVAAPPPSVVSSATAAAPPAPAPAKPEPLTMVVLFDFDRSALRAGDSPTLDDLGVKVKGGSYATVEAVGHSDRIGGDPYNLDLSKKRADAVVAYLVGKGVDPARIKTDAKGMGAAVTGEACRNMGEESAQNAKLVECLQKDRRVEIRVAN